ncbi:hypothetical protein [Symbioplanes lichenis]|uniref:hypothetical protein n=1 Tax=Symbioplanes lichenis TaxID=1629072 RepID=UPI00273A2F9F|nr:hypothetical protein [Actinoplanes lichenis]
MSARTIGLVLALGAGGVLVAFPPSPPAAPRVAGERAVLRDLKLHPIAFLDARTAVGTAPSSSSVRLLLGDVELRRLPAAGNPEFGTVTTFDGGFVWTESVDGGKVGLWTARTDGTGVRNLVADMGNTIFNASAYDVVVAESAVWWVTASATDVTEIRSVPLAGGAVVVRREEGSWSLTAWPWLTDGAGALRSLRTGASAGRPTTNTEQPVCSPVWCRVLVVTSGGLARIDAVRVDGTGRRRIAGPASRAAIDDVAVLDRFEVVSTPGPTSDVTGTEALDVYDLAADRLLPISPAVRGVFCRNGVLWWATGDPDALTWNTLDLRTV